MTLLIKNLILMAARLEGELSERLEGSLLSDGVLS